VFRGRFEHNLDVKGRLSIPHRYRKHLSHLRENILICTVESEFSIAVYPLLEWEKLEKELRSLPRFKEDVDAYKRFIISDAEECPLDRQGRVLIPANLRAKVEINKTVIINGMIDKFEIWDKNRWDEYEKHNRNNIPVIREKLAELGVKAL